MTHIEQMIQDMCPNGVEFKKLGEVTTIIRGERVTKSQLIENGQYPVVSGGVNPMGYIDKYNREENTITIAQYGSAGFVNYINEKFWANDVCYSVYPNEELINKFLYYYLVHKQGYFYAVRNTDAVPYSIALEKIKDLDTPIPPLEIQKKIVECLDKFSALAAELQAELQMRRKQYEYYRTQLLTPHSDCNSATKSDDAQWEWKTLGEITLPAVNIKWKHVDATTEYQYVDLTSVNRENRNIEGTNIINKETAPSRAQQIIETGDILFGTTRPTLQRYCYVPKEYNGQICSTGYCVLRANKNVVLPKWIYYQLSLNSFIDYVTANQSGAAYPSISDSQVKAYKIPLPPLAEQERIVSILDKFEALTTSLSDGIPAEQAAQQKRYEYYRDLLLTFDRKAV